MNLGARGPGGSLVSPMRADTTPARREVCADAHRSVAERLVGDRLAAVDGVGALGAVADVEDVLAGAAVDRAAAEVGLDVVGAGAGVDRVAAVAGVDEVGAVAAVDAVVLRGALARRLVVAPEDVASGAAGDRVGRVAAEQLVVAVGAGQRAARVGLVDLQDTVDGRPAGVAGLGLGEAAEGEDGQQRGGEEAGERHGETFSTAVGRVVVRAGDPRSYSRTTVAARDRDPHPLPRPGHAGPRQPVGLPRAARGAAR